MLLKCGLQIFNAAAGRPISQHHHWHCCSSRQQSLRVTTAARALADQAGGAAALTHHIHSAARQHWLWCDTRGTLLLLHANELISGALQLLNETVYHVLGTDTIAALGIETQVHANVADEPTAVHAAGGDTAVALLFNDAQTAACEALFDPIGAAWTVDHEGHRRLVRHDSEGSSSA